MSEKKFCIACGAPHKADDYHEESIDCSYCGFSFIKMSPLEKVHSRKFVEHYHNISDLHTTMMINGMAITGFISVVIMAVNYKELGAFSNIYFIIGAIFATMLMISVALGLINFPKQQKFLQDCNYDINTMRKEVENKSKAYKANVKAIDKAIQKYLKEKNGQ